MTTPESYCYDISYCSNLRQLGKLVNHLKHRRPKNSINRKFTMFDFDLYDSCLNEDGFLDAKLVLKKQQELMEDDKFPEFPFHTVALMGPAGSGKSTSMEFLNTYLSHAVYCAFTNVGTDNVNSKLLYEQSAPFGTLLANMRMSKPFPTFETQDCIREPINFKHAQLMSLAYDWYNISSMMKNIKKDLPVFFPFDGTSEEEDDYIWMLSSLFRQRHRSTIPQIAIADFIVIDESGLAPFQHLSTLAFLISMIRCYFQVKLDKTPVFILVGSVSQTYATKSSPDPNNTGLSKIVKTQSMLHYVFGVKAVADYTEMTAKDRTVIFLKNKRCTMEFLKPILAGLDIGKNMKSHSHILDALVVPRDVLTKPILEKRYVGAYKSGILTTSERQNTSEIDLSGYVRIAVGHNVLTEYRSACYKHLTGIEYPVYVVVLLNEIRCMIKGDVYSFLDDWLNNPTNNLGNHSQFKETLAEKFQRVSGVIQINEALWPPIDMKPPRPCPFGDSVTESDFQSRKCQTTQEKIQLVLYRSHVSLLTGKPMACRIRSPFLVTGFRGPFKKFIHNVYNNPVLFTSPVFCLMLIKSAILCLENARKPCDDAMEVDDAFSDDELLAVTELQDSYSFIMYLDPSIASSEQIASALSQALNVLSLLYEEVKNTQPSIQEEIVYLYTRDIWRLGDTAVQSLRSSEVLNMSMNIGSNVSFIDTRICPDHLYSNNNFYGKHKQLFPQLIRRSIMVTNDSGFLGLITPPENMFEIFDTEKRCTFKPLISYPSPVLDELAMTVTRSQGLTIPKVAGIVDGNINMESFYVMISRAQQDLVLSQNPLINNRFRYKPNKIMYDLLHSSKTRLIL